MPNLPSKLPIKRLALLLALLVALVPTPAFGAGVTLSLSPESGTQSAAFDVKIMLNTGSQEAGAVDIALTWEPEELEIAKANISAGADFHVVAVSVDEDRKLIEFTVYADEEFSGAALHLATLRFTPQKTSGTTELRLSQETTGVFLDGEDILNSVSGATYTLSSAIGGDEEEEEEEEEEETHRECQNEVCVEVSGAGSDECTTNSDCQSSSDVGGDTGGNTGGDAGEINTAGREDFMIFLTLFALSLITSGFLWLAIP